MLPRVFPSEKKHFKGSLPTSVKYIGRLLLLFSVMFISGVVYFSTHKFLTSSTSLSCINDDPSILHRRNKQNVSLEHAMSDKELFIAAIQASRLQRNPCKTVQKVAFMFLTKGPLPLSPLWEKFFAGNDGLYSIYVHSLPSFKTGYPPNSVFHKRRIPSQAAEWGKMSICDAERRLLANAMLDPSNDRFVLLSESCIPLRNFTTTHAYLTHSHLSFVSSFDDRGRDGRGRYDPRMAPRIQPGQWRKGSQWFELDRRLAAYVVEDTEYYSMFRSFCRPPCYVDEHYLPTMLHIERPSMIANRSLTFTDWSRGGAHPATFAKGDVSEGFVRRRLLRGGSGCVEDDGRRWGSLRCVLFARKFAPSALEPLLRLAPALLGIG